jgi:hypothetical protein
MLLVPLSHGKIGPAATSVSVDRCGFRMSVGTGKEDVEGFWSFGVEGAFPTVSHPCEWWGFSPLNMADLQTAVTIEATFCGMYTGPGFLEHGFPVICESAGNWVSRSIDWRHDGTRPTVAWKAP